MIRKALLIGIDKYRSNPLSCCINDVNELSECLSYNEDGSVNFAVKILTDFNATRSNIRKNIKELFSGDEDVCLFYFSGHGFDDNNDGIIVSYDYQNDDLGIKMSEILEIVNNSKVKFKIIIIDCCHSGFMGNHGIIGDTSYLGNGVIILTASRKNQSAIEIDGHGIFTNLLIESLTGGAADILGNITPGSVYTYIDQALGPWFPRPLFKANISEFISLRKFGEKISLNDLKFTLKLFPNEDYKYPLDPTYEETNFFGSEHYNKEPYSVEKNVEIFKKLKKCNKNGIIIPCDTTDMYFAAMEGKSCKLTPLGKHYWNMIKEKVL